MTADIDRPLFVLAFAAVTGLVFTALIMGLQAAAGPALELNEQEKVRNARRELFPDAKLETGPTLTDPETGIAFELILARGRQDPGRRIGYIVPVTGTGFWARIDGLLGVTAGGAVGNPPGTMDIRGLVFLSHQETPGLGGRITEREWREQFAGIDIDSPSPNGAFISIGKTEPAAGNPARDRHVDAITGATGTSTAVRRMLNTNIARFKRALAAHYASGKKEEG